MWDFCKTLNNWSLSEDDVHNEFVFSVGKFDTVRINQVSLIMRKHENFSHPYMLCHSFT